MAIAFVRTHGSSEDNDSDTSLTKTTVAAIPVGSLAVVVGYSEDAAITSVADTRSNSWASAREQQAGGATAFLEIFYTKVTTQIENGDTITMTISGNSRPKGMLVWEFSGPADSPLDQVQSASGTTSGAKSTGTTGTTAQNDELAVAAWLSDSAGVWTGDAAYTGGEEFGGSFAGGSGTWEGFAQYKILTATGTQSASADENSGLAAYAAAIVTFKASVAVPQTALPDADTTTTGWTNTPLFSKVNDASDATTITATLA